MRHPFSLHSISSEKVLEGQLGQVGTDAHDRTIARELQSGRNQITDALDCRRFRLQPGQHSKVGGGQRTLADGGETPQHGAEAAATAGLGVRVREGTHQRTVRTTWPKGQSTLITNPLRV